MDESHSSPVPLDPLDPLDKGLEAAFSTARASVLELVAGDSGVAPKILLRDSPSELGGSPVLRRSQDSRLLPRSQRNYQLLGEIARGGMGVVLKGHDTDLGRDVAVKVLDPELSKRPDVVQRFIEEAQIGGQLQHPGIVPVYELGLMADLRPYFTMKLVKGRTLAALLADRGSPEESRRSLLDTFEAVCQTLAYAHSRGVIHRDIKPANVMVGAFGEVQVVDWGLAKVLQAGGTADEMRATRAQAMSSVIETVRSEPGQPGTKSAVGSVMGTPAYMPPEQARGEVEDLDERSDVFSLGAMLCEILTGSPPYPGNHADALAAAATADLAGALQRLAACGAEAPLIALAKECMTPARAARPRRAEVVARRIHEHLVSVEERARAAQIEAAESRVQVLAERKARRLTLALATTVLLVGIGSVAVWTGIESARSRRRQEVVAKIETTLDDVERARGQQDWSSALAASERAKALADARETPASSRERVLGLAAAVEREASESRAREELARDTDVLLSELEDVRRPEDDEFLPSGARVIGGDPAAIFARHGLDPLAGTVEEAASRIAARDRNVELAAFLDEWSSIGSDAADPERRGRLIAVANLLDPDPTRVEIRAAFAAGDQATLRRIATTTNVRMAPVATTTLLGHALLRNSEFALGARILGEAHQAHPQDFVLTMDLGFVCEAVSGHNASHAARFFAAATALRPKSVEARHRLGLVLDQYLDDHEEAARVFEAALELLPGDPHLRWHLARALANSGRRDNAIVILRELVERDPGDPLAVQELGGSLIETGRPAEAVEFLERALELTSEHAVLFEILGRAQLALGELDAALASARKSTELDPAQDRHWNVLGAVLQKRGELSEAVEAFRRAIELAPGQGMLHKNLALALEAKGDLPAAIASYRRAAALEAWDAKVQFRLAQALSEAGDFPAAAEAYRRVVELDPGHAHAHNNLGALLQGQGRLEEALASYRRSLEIDGNVALAHLNAGDMLGRLGRDDEAVESYRRAVELDPELLPAHHRLGHLLDARGDQDAAIESFRRAIELDGDDAELANDLAWALATHPVEAARRPEEAVTLARRAVEGASDQGNYWNTLGVALYRAGDSAGCTEALQRSMDLRAGGDPHDWLFLAMAQHALGNAEEARGWLERSLDWLSRNESSPQLERDLAEARSALESR